MARITVEDCKKVLNNRFKLIIIAADRTREILLGSPTQVTGKSDKETIIALREIAMNKIDIDKCYEELIKKHQRYSNIKKKNYYQDQTEDLYKLFHDHSKLQEDNIYKDVLTED